ncbi:MAG: penicillin-binding protein activator LpoB, partial [Armatimonadetes bacterium CG_4_10_14_3_um_filter_66_18]
MKNLMRSSLLVAVVLTAAILGGCSSGKQVSRIDVGEQIDLSGRWNDTDSRQVSA